MSRCWAHNLDRVRCELDAGHDGNHTVYITWQDSECYEPDKSTVAPIVMPKTNPTQEHMNPPLSTATAPPAHNPANDRCVACQHRHRGRECPGACECKEFIG